MSTIIYALNNFVATCLRIWALWGSQKRIHYAFEVLREQGWTQEELDMVYAPIGLDLGAQTPEEIALSIVSEYLAVVRGKKGGSLRKGRVSHES